MPPIISIPGTPSSQMLRYLSRAEVASDRAVQWGVLTNGSIWRLYWQSARSRSEEFLEFDLAKLAGVAGVNADLFAHVNVEDVHYLRAFCLLFRREAFLPQPGDAQGRSFHAIALDAGRLWETKVSQDLGQRVFDDLFPRLAAAIAKSDPRAPHPNMRDYLDEVHRAALIVLYRLLFVLYAEDRNLLPVADSRYDDYSLRWLRNDIARRMDQGDAFSATAPRAWQHLRSLFRAIDNGDASIGLPPYNGGLFHESPGDILARIELPDAVLAPLIDGLSRKPNLSGRGFINYRDLAVQHLGSIYERLLEQRLVEDASGKGLGTRFVKALQLAGYSKVQLHTVAASPEHTQVFTQTEARAAESLADLLNVSRLQGMRFPVASGEVGVLLGEDANTLYAALPQ